MSGESRRVLPVVEELHPSELRRACQLAEAIKKKFGSKRAAVEATKGIGKELGLSEAIAQKLYAYLSSFLTEAEEKPEDEPKADPKAAPKKDRQIEDGEEKGEKEEPEKEEPEDNLENPAPVLVAPVAPGSIVDEDGEDDDDDDDDEEGKNTQTDVPSDASQIGDMARLALAPSSLNTGRNCTESWKSPKMICLESTTGSAVTGSSGVGILDVGAYGGYLEKALPYLFAATLSRMDEDSKAKFVQLYRKFIESNDISELTEVAGKLADTVEWADASQEGAELTKTLRFFSEMMNVMKGSIDMTKRAVQTSGV